MVCSKNLPNRLDQVRAKNEREMNGSARVTSVLLICWAQMILTHCARPKLTRASSRHTGCRYVYTHTHTRQHTHTHNTNIATQVVFIACTSVCTYIVLSFSSYHLTRLFFVCVVCVCVCSSLVYVSQMRLAILGAFTVPCLLHRPLGVYACIHEYSGQGCACRWV